MLTIPLLPVSRVGDPFDKGAWHAHACAKGMLNTRHNDLAKLLCEFAREAGMRANCEQIAVELPTPGVTEETGEPAENKKGDPNG